jgi:hypothetical protein
VIDDVCVTTDIQRPYNFCLLSTNTADKIRGALLVDTALTGLWPAQDDWTMLEHVLNQDVVSMFHNTKLKPVEDKESLSEFIDKVFNQINTWEDVLKFEWTKNWQDNFLTFQLFFQFITLMRQTGVEGKHRQEVTNRVLFGFHPDDPFPLKQQLSKQGRKAYEVKEGSTVNKAVKLSIISRRFNYGKRNFVFFFFRNPPDYQEPHSSFNDATEDNKIITMNQLEQLRAFSETVTESRDLHITNDWSHIINEVITGYHKQEEFRLVTENDFVCNFILKTSKKSKKETDKHIGALHKLHLLIAEVLFKTQPGKQAVVNHSLDKTHVVTQDGWNEKCLEESSSWIAYSSTPHPVVSCLMRFEVIFVSKLTVRRLAIYFLPP